MARMTLVLEDMHQDGQQAVKGTFKTEDAPQPPAPNLPAPLTPAMLLMATIQRIWDRDVIPNLMPLVTADLAFRNQIIEREMVARQAKERAPIPLDKLPTAMPALPAPPAANDGAAAGDAKDELSTAEQPAEMHAAPGGGGIGSEPLTT